MACRRPSQLHMSSVRSLSLSWRLGSHLSFFSFICLFTAKSHFYQLRPLLAGHVLSMPHDDSKTCERLFGELGGHYLMAPLFVSLNDTAPWSPCSALYITEFFDNGLGRKCSMLAFHPFWKWHNEKVSEWVHVPPHRDLLPTSTSATALSVIKADAKMIKSASSSPQDSINYGCPA